MVYDIMKDLDRIVRRRSKGESLQARTDRLRYYVEKWHDAYLSGDPTLRMCAIMILTALDAPEILKEWQRSEQYITKLMNNLLTHGTDPE